ncbi:hypothetical protein EJ02DRAFT_57049 [Clathrospora elynae]|uniref:Uncharacterized protein n=1 Tax=Clathrospora elynae TaxID=706981 RepID=A0A6A5SBP3_9PLEO|nr:hypothetical protein EJ02DRAFT_57049 [Clathrospora elynae]
MQLIEAVEAGGLVRSLRRSGGLRGFLHLGGVGKAFWRLDLAKKQRPTLVARSLLPSPASPKGAMRAAPFSSPSTKLAVLPLLHFRSQIYESVALLKLIAGTLVAITVRRGSPPHWVPLRPRRVMSEDRIVTVKFNHIDGFGESQTYIGWLYNPQ